MTIKLKFVSKKLMNIYGFKFGSFNDYLFAKYNLGAEKEGFKEQTRKFMTALRVIAEMEKPKSKSRAADMAKSRKSAAGYIRDARLTERAAKSLDSLCVEWGMNKTQVINKLLEEQEQRQLL